MRIHASRLALAASLTGLSACGGKQAPTAVPEGQPQPYHHELRLPPVGPSVHVTLDGKAADVVVSTIPHESGSPTITQLWKVAFPLEDAVPLHFDLFGSDGFHPGARPKCTRLLTGAELTAAHIDVVTHDVSFNEGTDLPGCYRVKAVVRIDATR
jgi:hypothetical protein